MHPRLKKSHDNLALTMSSMSGRTFLIPEVMNMKWTDIKLVFKESDTNKFLGETRELDLLKFWSSASVKEKFPRLSCIALGVLSNPASSSSSERAFGCFGNTITKKRSRLPSLTVDALLVLNSKFRSEENKCLISL